YRELLSDEESKEDLIATIVDILGYAISPEYLFNVLADQAKQATFQLNDLNKAFLASHIYGKILSAKFE
ncbi:TPA: restriction endonuclease subunit M, partial [Enterococcus faecium]|nr:restriction endonuclease subunit M [Enterococcus faecium]HCD4475216.1 restriction endonuclease subunit M [Enterococcus faecium]